MDPKLFQIPEIPEVVISKRELYCPNCKIPSLEEDFDNYNRDGPRLGIDYNPWTLRPITKLCDHSKCQPFTEYEFAMIDLFLQKKITKLQWTESRPQSRSLDDKFSLKPKEWCYGKTLQQHKIRPLWIDEEPIPCSHTSGSCVLGSAAAIGIHHLVKTDHLSSYVLDQIHSNGWARACEDAIRFKKDPISKIFETDGDKDYMHLWRPFMMDEWMEVKENEYERQLELARSTTDEDKILRMLKHSRLKCHYERSGDKIMTILKRRHETFTFEMRHTPEVVSKLTKSWLATGGDASKLVECIENKEREYNSK